MDPPIISETAFTSANPSSYTLSEIWPFKPEPNGGLSGLRIGELGGPFGDRNGSSSSTVTEHGGGGKKRRGLTEEEEEESKAVSTSNGGVGPCQLNDRNDKLIKTPRSRKENSDSNPEMESSSNGNKPAEQSGKISEPSKDYIHVRARRGQATDSHSLAERARREKISERMKILQDLVPGCNKIVGKALVLDEIINYVQSLQRQVEFLSMKVEAVNSQVNISPAFEGIYPKDLAAPSFDASGMMFGPHATGEHIQGSQAEWQQMHVGGGGFERTI